MNAHEIKYTPGDLVLPHAVISVEKHISGLTDKCKPDNILQMGNIYKLLCHKSVPQ